MKFKFTIQPYQTEAVDSVVSVFSGQPFHDRFTYRRDVAIERDVINWNKSDPLSIKRKIRKAELAMRRQGLSFLNVMTSAQENPLM